MRTLILLGMMLVVAGCAVQQNPAQTKIYTPYGTLKYHCPPGQAKKGNC